MPRAAPDRYGHGVLSSPSPRGLQWLVLAVVSSQLFPRAWASPATGESCDDYVERERREFLREHPGATPAELAAYLAGEQEECAVEGRPDSGRAETYETTTVGRAAGATNAAPRATTKVTRRELDERLPRSAPDALRWEPGVYVQQTAHAQGSAYVRGVTGQQTVMLFDGIRLNNSTYRQGPNQYFFTIDSHTVSSLEVTRGSGSVLWGSDALGGVLAARPIEPMLREGVQGLRATPRTSFRTATADDELGGRFELDAQLGDRIGLVGGVGYREVGLLEAGGKIHDSVTKSYSGGERVLVPEFAEDGRTQLGTGFREAASDLRLVARLGERGRAIAALYDYRQFDAPRTDKCPPPFAPRGECVVYEEQLRTLGYLALEADLGPAARQARVVVSLQRQRERRRNDRPSSIVDPFYGRDTVLSTGLTARATTARWSPAPADLWLDYGVDTYRDDVTSVAWYEIHTDRNDVLRYLPRGQYLDGSSYTWGGVYANANASLWERLHARAGGRLSAIEAYAPAEEESGSAEISRGWVSAVGGAGLGWDVAPGVTLAANADQGFRAPNLDDLTSRQATGPGFQFENAALRPERSWTLEVGTELSRGPLRAGLWAYRMTIDDAIARRLVPADECPPNLEECRSSWFAYKLVNLAGTAEILGLEGLVMLQLPHGLSVRATAAFARGEGDNPAPRPSDPSVTYDERVPLSRVPPLNGTAELVWRPRGTGLYVGGGVRWAALQDRLAPQDESDPRIPLGGTPAFAVVDLRAGYRVGRRFSVAVIVENLGDAAYRYHGSSVNGPGRGLVFTAELGL